MRDVVAEFLTSAWTIRDFQKDQTDPLGPMGTKLQRQVLNLQGDLLDGWVSLKSVFASNAKRYNDISRMASACNCVADTLGAAVDLGGVAYYAALKAVHISPSA